MPTESPAPSVIVINLIAPNGENFEGAAWSLYTTSASQAGVAPYLTGFVSAGNRIELVDLPPARYRLVVQPVGFEQVEITFASSGTPAEFEMPVLAQIAPTPTSTATTPEPTATTAPQSTSAAPTSTTTPTSTAVSTAPAAANPTVSALPATGTSGSDTTPMLLMISTSAFVALIVAAIAIRRNDA